MPRLRFVPFLLVVLTLLVVDAHLYTLFIPGWGLGTAEYTLAFIVLTAVALAVCPLLARRRVTSLTLAVTGTAVAVTSLVLLFAHETLRRTDLREWLTFWHAAWSWAFLLALAAHLVRNHVRLRQFLHVAPSRAVAVAWLLLAGVAAVTALPDAWPPLGRAGRPLVVSALVLALAGGGAAWWVRAGRGATPHVAPLRRKPRRALVDVHLVTATTLAFVTGFVILYADTALRVHDLRHAGVFWHAVTSGLMLAFAGAHVAANARMLGAHGRRVGREVVGSKR